MIFECFPSKNSMKNPLVSWILQCTQKASIDDIFVLCVWHVSCTVFLFLNRLQIAFTYHSNLNSLLRWAILDRKNFGVSKLITPLWIHTHTHTYAQTYSLQGREAGGQRVGVELLYFLYLPLYLTIHIYFINNFVRKGSRLCLKPSALLIYLLGCTGLCCCAQAPQSQQAGSLSRCMWRPLTVVASPVAHLLGSRSQ